MSLEIWQESVVLAELPSEPDTSEELDSITRYVRDRGDYDVVIDFSNVTILTSMSLASLLRLRDVLGSCERRLLLCGVNRVTRGVFSVTTLDSVFEIVDDRLDALATLQARPDSPTVIRIDSP